MSRLGAKLGSKPFLSATLITLARLVRLAILAAPACAYGASPAQCTRTWDERKAAHDIHDRLPARSDVAHHAPHRSAGQRAAQRHRTLSRWPLHLQRRPQQRLRPAQRRPSLATLTLRHVYCDIYLDLLIHF